ncbi:uncharacterized protein LOC129769999 isoform X2 [Toxorhynchites rutilus septentrionalis]|uniref:uncharacterized protein LOC129769999 isoform X2 n=1 Tax=Toxorhynchites rutilus septentrionalis TaxID=329112 RepID=UPI00247A8D83|nr:uncharacterized protein LOC129769999 isoform X2 [Toxorhynchites rutilus septentrionalis]
MIRFSLTTIVFTLFANRLLLDFVVSGMDNIDFVRKNDESSIRPKMESLFGSPGDSTQPIFSDGIDATYFVVALHGGAKLWGRSLTRTLLDMGAPFSNPKGPPLKPLIVELQSDGRFSSTLLKTLCDLIDGTPIVGIVVIGDGQAAKMIAFAGSAMKVPVLWARGGMASFQSTANEHMSTFQAILYPSARQILEALRSLLLQAHWYSFYILSDIKTTTLLAGSEGFVLKRKPLHPTILQLPIEDEFIYRQLAIISKSTRGIVILLCELHVARRILFEAKRMKMLNGHFIWLWANTVLHTNLHDSAQMPFGIFGMDAEEEITKHANNPFRSVKTELEEDFYDTSDIIRQSHIADLVERKMDFEYFLLKNKKNYTDSKKNIDHLNDDNNNSLNLKNGYRNAKEDKHNNRTMIDQKYVLNGSFHLSFIDDYSPFEDDGANMRKNRSRNVNPSNGATLTFIGTSPNDRNHKDRIPTENNELFDWTTEKQKNAGLKIKRTKNFLKQYNASSYVLFHHFQDFPVGLLALRAVSMKLDRHMIRSTIRLFASTWAKVEQEDYAARKLLQSREKLIVKSNQRSDHSQKYKRSVFNKTYESYAEIVTSYNSRIKENDVNNNKTLEYSGNNDITNKRLLDVDTETISTENIYISDRNDRVNKTIAKTSQKKKRRQSWWSTKDHSESIKNLRSYNDGNSSYRNGCFGTASCDNIRKNKLFTRYLQEAVARGLSGQPIIDGVAEKSFITHFELLNLVPIIKRNPIKYDKNQETASDHFTDTNFTKWRRVGFISGRVVNLDTIVWPNGDIVVAGLTSKARSVFRVVIALAPPFVMETELGEHGQCLRGLICYKIHVTGRQNLTQMFNQIETETRHNRPGESDKIIKKSSSNNFYSVRCCYGLSMDLLQKVARDIGFEFHLYIVHDGLFGRKIPSLTDSSPAPKKETKKRVQFSKFDAQSGRSLKRGSKLLRIMDIEQEAMNARVQPEPHIKKLKRSKIEWNGIIGDLATGSADMSFAPLTISKERAEIIDFTVPFFHGGVSLLAAPQSVPDVPLFVFLLPFSPELWIAIFTSLNITAIAVAIYEWLSPFGLNPWGRQRSKNFSISSALWVMWGLLCGHLVAFKAPKSWPNKFLINVWGGFSVIFIASYTANIAALIAGLFFHNEAGSYSGPLLKHRVGAPYATAAESYIQRNDAILWEHMKKYQLMSIQEGIERLKNGTIDLLMADSPILDYYRATDQGCSFQRVGDTYVDNAYAIGMSKGFPLKETISALISKYSSDGYLDILTEKWYGGLSCYKMDREIVQPRPLGVAAVAGVFILLGLGMILGLVILLFEHLFYKYTLPILRHQPSNTIWRSRNIMFFSQKLYRFINCAELVSPHHAAKELVHSIRQGQITSLFQKSIKREDEQRRRRKSKAQFFDMIQEIRRVQQEERDTTTPMLTMDEKSKSSLETTMTPKKKVKQSPKMSIFGIGISSSNPSMLNIRRFSTDSVLSERLDNIGRRLSRDMTNSPPDFARRFETFGKQSDGGDKFDTYSGKESKQIMNGKKFDTFSGTIYSSKNDEEIDPQQLMKTSTKQNKRLPLNSELFVRNKKHSKGESRKLIPIEERVAHGLAPAFVETDTSGALLRDKLHEELRMKYASQGINILKSVGPQQNTKPNKTEISSDISQSKTTKILHDN